MGRMLTAVAAALLLALLGGAPAEAAKFGSKCGGSNFECTRVNVPLDRSGAISGEIPLYVERSPGGGREAVFALAGGPGQGNSTITESFNRDLSAALTGGRYLVVFDQRGTGRSEALDCPELERESRRPLDVRAAACADRLGPKRALYTTRESVEDLEAVRKEVGDERITLYGVSYGTKVAEAYALRYPEHVERLVLDSVVEPEGQAAFDVDTFRALPRVLREVCRGECARVTPDLAAGVATLAERLRAEPLRGPWVGRGGRRRTVSLSARDLYLMLRSGDLNASTRAEYPGAIRSAVEGDPAPLLRMEHRFDGLGGSDDDEDPPEEAVRSLSFSLFTTTLCEEAPLPWDRSVTDPAERLRQARARAAAVPDEAFLPFDRDTALELDGNNLIFQCLRWPAAAAAPELGAGPLPDVPVLVLEGEEDLRTPLEVGRRVADRFAHATVVAVPKTAHAVVGSPGAGCVETALRRFFADRAVGTPCAGAKRRGARVLPKLPARLADVRPARGVAGTARARTLAATELTLRDMYGEYYNGAFLLSHVRGGGLRGGSFSERPGGLRMRSLTLVPGVAVSGYVVGLAEPRGRLRVTGSGGAVSGTLTLRRSGLLSGRLGGRRVQVRFGPPRAFGL